MGLTPQHQRRCTSRLRRWPLAAGTGAGALARAPVVAGCGYSNSTSDSLVNQALTSSNMQAMYSWQDFLSAQPPMIRQPQADRHVNAIANNLQGVYPLSPTLSINPENWYFVN